MKKWCNRKVLLQLVASGLLASELVFLLDAVVVFSGRILSVYLAALLLAMVTLLIFFLFRRNTRRILITSVGIPLVLTLVTVTGYICWGSFRAGADYESPDAGKHQLYGERKVMVVVPHQDDEVNILGGVMEEYVRYGSELYVVYVTNGDYAEQAQTRYKEALASLDSIGIPEDHAIFLGYGDGWQEGGSHIYNAEPGVLMTSHAGKTETYGTERHGAYREGRAYTIDNLMEDLKSVILEYRPDVLFCSDYDHHIDHKATTLLFDKVMGRILKEVPEYTPVVYKAYAYGTAWESEPDYYADVVLSTQNLFAQPYDQQPAVYRWEDRVRFPVDGSVLSRSLVSSRAFAQLALYESQGAQLMAARVVSGDRVAWQRYTDSLCRSAEITATSGQTDLLNDFMLIENRDLTDGTRKPYDGIWMPDPDDNEKTITVRLPQPSDIASVVLYDHPSGNHNILDAEIRFDNGASIKTGPLDAGGAATTIAVDQKDVSSFTVAVTDAEGEQAGLGEIEAFSRLPEADGRFLKLTDEEGNFLYDVWTGEDGWAEFPVYAVGDLPVLNETDYLINTDSEKGTAVLENGKIRVFCPAGEKLVLNVTCKEAGVSDSITVRNPGALERIWIDFWQTAEQEVFERYSSKAYKNLAVVSLWTKLSYVIRHL